MLADTFYVSPAPVMTALAHRVTRPRMQIAVFCVTVDGEERFAAFCADADLRTIRGLDRGE